MLLLGTLAIREFRSHAATRKDDSKFGSGETSGTQSMRTTCFVLIRKCIAHFVLRKIRKAAAGLPIGIDDIALSLEGDLLTRPAACIEVHETSGLEL
jgi:hypothetical protein